ncbi:helix-turn-helix domain-containing protein [Streptomyces sp. Tu6071]|uniref:helix-turn-helix domain-containing protein n=1 Tax=Streptomyces sp. Tu6071 TaxID=355249 RepID=UPI0005BBA5C2|nr:helix-turn-helix domain-containing protein [Streptomyces sp. Tu6071]
MYARAVRTHALALVDQGRSINSVSKQTGISRSSLRGWRERGEPVRAAATCCRCQDLPTAPADPAAYSYLLGLYLGDGCLSRSAKGVHTLRIACADAWPGLQDACEAALRAVLPQNSVWRTPCAGCTAVSSSSKHWACLFPQHGPGKKHDRTISLADWQQDVVTEFPWEFVRGLVHSDGCRVTNWTVRTVNGEPKRYEYPRYFFTNKSADIRRLYCATLDELGVAWKAANKYNISVARKASVALMDAHIGPKY